MAGYLNKVQLIGNLGRDPEIRHSQDGNKIATLTLATTEYWRDKNTNERRDRTEWHRVVIFNEHLTDICEKYLRKGSKIYLEGQLQTRKWTDNNGQERYTTEVVLQRFRGELMMMDNRNGESTSDSGPEPLGFPSQNSQNSANVASAHTNDLDDEIPF